MGIRLLLILRLYIRTYLNEEREHTGAIKTDLIEVTEMITTIEDEAEMNIDTMIDFKEVEDFSAGTTTTIVEEFCISNLHDMKTVTSSTLTIILLKEVARKKHISTTTMSISKMLIRRISSLQEEAGEDIEDISIRDNMMMKMTTNILVEGETISEEGVLINLTTMTTIVFNKEVEAMAAIEEDTLSLTKTEISEFIEEKTTSDPSEVEEEEAEFTTMITL